MYAQRYNSDIACSTCLCLSALHSIWSAKGFWCQSCAAQPNSAKCACAWAYSRSWLSSYVILVVSACSSCMLHVQDLAWSLYWLSKKGCICSSIAPKFSSKLSPLSDLHAVLVLKFFSLSHPGFDQVHHMLLFTSGCTGARAYTYLHLRGEQMLNIGWWCLQHVTCIYTCITYIFGSVLDYKILCIGELLHLDCWWLAACMTDLHQYDVCWLIYAGLPYTWYWGCFASLLLKLAGCVTYLQQYTICWLIEVGLIYIMLELFCI